MSTDSARVQYYDMWNQTCRHIGAVNIFGCFCSQKCQCVVVNWMDVAGWAMCVTFIRIGIHDVGWFILSLSLSLSPSLPLSLPPPPPHTLPHSRWSCFPCCLVWGSHSSINTSDYWSSSLWPCQSTLTQNRKCYLLAHLHVNFRWVLKSLELLVKV